MCICFFHAAAGCRCLDGAGGITENEYGQLGAGGGAPAEGPSLMTLCCLPWKVNLTARGPRPRTHMQERRQPPGRKRARGGGQWEDWELSGC